MGSKTLIQIYEIQTPEEAEAMADLGVDHVGTVVLDPEAAKDPALAAATARARERGRVSSVIPLFSDFSDVAQTVEALRPHILHFCDDLLTPEGRAIDLSPLLDLQRRIKERFPEVAVMRSIPIPPPGRAHLVDSLALARELEPVSDWFLTDTWLGGGDKEPVAGFIGITGLICDWDVAAKLVERSRIPVVLAGGLGPENVYQGILHTRPAGVDSCTNTNKKGPDGSPVRFRKDPARVREFADETARADREQGFRTDSL